MTTNNFGANNYRPKVQTIHKIQLTMEELLIVSIHGNHCYTSCLPEDVEKEIARAKESYAQEIEGFASLKNERPKEADYWQSRIEESSAILQSGFEAITWKEYVKRQRETWLSKEPKEITEDEYNYALEVLPPLKWIRNERYSQFFIGECTTMTFYGQYLHDKASEKYYCALTDILDESTWLDKMLGLV